jgi:hypothetical protein
VPLTIELNATAVEALRFLAKLKGKNIQAEGAHAIHLHLESELKIFVSSMEGELARRRKARRAD